ncbi:phosphate starvation-inducible protein PhoH [Faunimonas pinastri]|uniref:Phosphate starvation-inducible protein PhoH n=1 Tax=Faunimonas pinastri TaxID=1855383 RepID=A0A1H9N0N7_9HYPH|nr:PhoH family protein [Faunimonas pinastri]SER29502.1 phosphate starvation-inducible protein PhoH [Faunimonas pinastri]
MASKNRAANRQDRRQGKTRNNEPLLRLVQDEAPTRHVRPSNRELKPLNASQVAYDTAIQTGTITFGIGPAGTGKTWWAASRAAEALKARKIERIIVTRPAVEAGESLGFLPGELDEKYEPYFRPVRDALEETLGSGALEYHLKAGTIEAWPLAFLRGATIKNAWLIADEMQNASITQMKLLLTRIGENSKFIINGDPSQCDLPDRSKSGLEDAVLRLGHVGSIKTVRFGVQDIVRHGIVQDIVNAYSGNAADPESDRYVSDDTDGLHRVLRFHG